MTIKHQLQRAIEPVLLLLAVGSLAGIVLFSPQGFTSDESWHLNQVGYVVKHGFTVEFLENYRGSPGPLFVWMHMALMPLTELRLPWVRLINVALFTAMLPLVWLLARRAGWNRQHALRAACAMAAFAPLWKIAGLAYTEMVAVVFATLAVFLLPLRYSPALTEGAMPDAARRTTKLPWVSVTFCALCATLAVLGRQPFLLLPAVVGLFALAGLAPRKEWTVVAVLAVVLPLFVFYIWGGLQPPTKQDRPEDFVTGFHFAILAAFYASLITLLLRPDWLLKWGLADKTGIISMHAASVVLAVAVALVVGLPAAGLRMENLIGDRKWLDLMVRGAILIMGMAMYLRLTLSVWQTRHDPVRLLSVILAAGLIAGHLMVGLVFSNRYMAIAAPFLIMAWGPDLRKGWGWAIGYLLAIGWGIVSLWGHLDGRQGPPFYDGGAEHFYPHLWQDVPEVYSEHYWNQFDYGNSEFLRNPLVGEPVLEPWRPEPVPENSSE